MNKLYNFMLVLALLILFSSSALANEVEGKIESINKDSQSFVVNGAEFIVTPSTRYDDGLKNFSDLKKEERVEVDYVVNDGKNYVNKVEREYN